MAAGWVAAIGTTKLEELKGRIPWYGSLFNHAGVLPSILGALVYQLLANLYDDRVISFLAALAGGVVVIFMNLLINAAGVSLLRQLNFRLVLAGDTQGVPSATSLPSRHSRGSWRRPTATTEWGG